MATKVQIIAEIAQAHDGSLGIAHSYIDALANTGVDAIKFQTHIAEAESSQFEPFRVKFSYEDDTRFDYWKRMEFTAEQWVGLKKHCDDVGIEFLSSPFSISAVDLLENLGVRRYKIGSGEVNNYLLLDRIGRTGKPVILSSGMSSFVELDAAIDFLKPYGNQLSILQCTTSYPTKPKQWGLNVMDELKLKYDLPIGFSDHSASIYAPLAATARGAEILEFHVVFDKQMFGPDSKASLTINEVAMLVQGVREIEESLNTTVNKEDNSAFTPLKEIFEKSLALNKNLKKGNIISIDDLETKKPKGYGISAHEFLTVIGKRLNRDMLQWEFLNQKDLQ